MDGKHLCRKLRIANDADDRLVLLTLDAQCFHCHFCKAKSCDIQSSSVASENRNDVGHELERIYWNISRALMAFFCAWKACCERWKVICKILLDFQWIYGFCGLPTELEFISYFISLSSRFPINFSCFHPETRTMGFAIDWEFITRIFQIASSLQAASLNLHFPAPHCVRARGIKKIDNFPQHLLSPPCWFKRQLFFAYDSAPEEIHNGRFILTRFWLEETWKYFCFFPRIFDFNREFFSSW